MPNYTKLFNSIVTSTIWTEDDKTRIVWITMLALADQNGEVHSSIPGLARLAGVATVDAERALEKFLSPDKFSRTPDNEGRRIAPIDGGWEILNHAKYRRMASAADAKEKTAQRVRRHRERNADVTVRNGHVTQCNADVTVQTDKAEAEAEAEAERETERERLPSGSVLASPPVTLEQAKQAAPSMGVTPQAAEMWWLDRDGVGWLEKGHPIRNWRSNLTAYGRRWAANEHKNGRRGKELPESETHFNHLAPDLF